MPSATYVHADGEDSQTIEVPIGTSVMAAGVQAGVRGIVAECGGSLSCATCHVYVESTSGSLKAISDDEDEMLDWTASPREPSSRLSCQLVLDEPDQTIVVRVPDKQV